MTKEISIITLTEASPNRIAFFQDLVHSLNMQELVNIHWIVSTPSQEAFNTITEGIEVPSDCVIYTPGDNLGKRRNDLLQQADTEFIMNIDDDDYLLHKYSLSNAIRELEENPEASATIGRIITHLPDRTYETWNESPVRGKLSYQLPQGIYHRSDLMEIISRDKVIPVYSGAAVYKNNDNLQWSEDLDVYEDIYALLSGIQDAFVMSADIRYVYRNHDGNTMLTFTDEKKMNNLTTMLYMLSSQ